MSINPINTSKAQTCPHGLPPGACPTCSSMGGGGVKQKKADAPQKNEMSYAQCYAIWMRMKAADRREAQAELNMQRQAEFMLKAHKMLITMSDKLIAALNKIENLLPFPMDKVFSATVNNILKPVLNLIANFPNFIDNIAKFVQNIQREIYIVAEKLASVFGEIKNFIQKKVSETFKKFTKKVFKILNIFGLESEEDFEEEEKVNAEIAAYKAKDVVSIKEFLISLARMERKPEDDNITPELLK